MNRPTSTRPSLTEACGLDTGPVPSRLYTDPAQYELERERIFRRAWLKVGRVEQIPDAGDYFVKDIAVCAASILVTRTKGGALKAFHNVCSHRGNLVALSPCGNASRFTCRYHSWTYDNAGKLVGVPDEAGFFGLDKKRCGLTPVALDTWEGWIFVNLQPVPEVSLAEFLGPFGTAFSGVDYPYADHALVMRGEFKANWKAVADAFSEAYHIASIHPRTFAPIYAGRDNPGSRPVSANVYGAHRAFSTWLNVDYQPGPNARFERWVYPAVATLTGTRQEGQVNPLTEHPAINPSKSTTWASDVNWIFPNWHIQISANRFWSHEFWPLSADTTLWEGRFYQPRPQSARERIQLEHFTAQMADGMLEDLSNIESTQRGMASGAKSHLHLQDGEIAIRHQLAQVVKWCEAATVAEALA
ncbi:MAG: aromatic ring-hydroxylating dioxygenase subunit alpha [Gammaproteobacteria bacterium]